MAVELLTVNGSLTLGLEGPPEAPGCERCQVSRSQIRVSDFQLNVKHDFCATCLLDVCRDAAAFRALAERLDALGMIPADGRTVTFDPTRRTPPVPDEAKPESEWWCRVCHATQAEREGRPCTPDMRGRPRGHIWTNMPRPRESRQ